MTSTSYTVPPESPFGRLFLPLIAVSLVALYFLSRTPGSPLVLTGLGGLFGLGYLPGLAVAVWVERRFGLWASWILPLMAAPVAVTAATLALVWFGMPLGHAPAWIVLVSAGLVLFAPQPQREIEDWAVSLEMPSLIRTRSDRQQVLLLAGMVLVIAALPMVTREWLRDTGYPAFHADVARLLPGEFPPEDPLLAGFPLRHFWAFHVYLSLIADATAADLEMLLVGGSLIAAFTLVFTAYRFLTLLGLGHARALWGTIFLFFSLGGLFPVSERVAAWATESAPFDWAAMWSRHASFPAMPGLVGGFPEGARLFLEPFLFAGPTSWGLVYLVLFLTAALGGLGQGVGARMVVAFLSALGLAAFQPAIGGVLALVMVLAVPATLAVCALSPFRRPGWEILLWPVPIAFAALAAWPYLRAITLAGGFDLTAAYELGARRSALLAGAVLPELLLGVPAVFGFLAASDVRRQAWAVWCMLLLAVAQFVDFGAVRANEGPILLLHLAFGLSAGTLVPVLWERARTAGRAALAVLLVILLVPKTVLGIGALLSAADPRDARDETRAVIEWIERETPADAVLVDYLPDLGLAANRALLLGDRTHLIARGYRGNPVTVRNLTFLGLLRGEQVSESQEAHLRELDGPLYLLRRRPQDDALAVPPFFIRVFENEAYLVYRWEPPLDRGSYAPAHPDSTASPR